MIQKERQEKSNSPKGIILPLKLFLWRTLPPRFAIPLGFFTGTEAWFFLDHRLSSLEGHQKVAVLCDYVLRLQGRNIRLSLFHDRISDFGQDLSSLSSFLVVAISFSFDI